MYQVCDKDHLSKSQYREKFISQIDEKKFSGIGIPKKEWANIEILNNAELGVLKAFLFIDRTGRTLDQIGLDSGLYYEEIEKLNRGEI